MEKKVLVLITTGFVSWGGLTTAFMNYYNAMNFDDLKIDIASFNDPDLPLINKLNSKSSYIKLTNKREKPLKYLVEFARLCGNYDVVHIHGNSPTIGPELYIAKVKGVKTRIAHCHNSVGEHPFMNVFLSPILLNSYTIGLAVSSEAAWIYKNKKYIILKNAIDTDKFKFCKKNRIQIRNYFGIKEDEYVIGHCGKFVKQKNHKFLIEVFREIHKINSKTKLLLVGDGELRKEIEEIVNKYHLNSSVIFCGMQNDTSKFYSAMDLFMFPSLWEGLPLATLEAQASGLKCLDSEFVPTESNVTKTVKYLKLDINEWIEAFNKNDDMPREKFSEDCVKILKNVGYDNKVAADNLRKIYMSE